MKVTVEIPEGTCCARWHSSHGFSLRCPLYWDEGNGWCALFQATPKYRSYPRRYAWDSSSRDTFKLESCMRSEGGLDELPIL